MKIKTIEKEALVVSIGTFDLDLYEIALNSSSDIEKLASILNHVLTDFKQ